MIRNKCLYACHTVNAVSCLGEKTFLLTHITYILCRVSDPHFFFADPDPGKNFHADPVPVPDPDPDPGGIRGRGVGVKGKNDFF